jgi:SAM-dependent methyltransferase
MPSTSSTFVAADSDGYERLMGRWSRRLAEPFLDFVNAPPASRVLDVGCGTGSLADAWAQRGPRGEFFGVDIAPVYVERARHRLADARATFDVQDACALDLPDDSFDCAVSLLVLHFVPDATRAIAEMARVTRAGGIAAAAVWDVRGGFVANRIFFDTAAALDADAVERRARNYTRPMTRPGELARAWRQAGLRDVVETTLVTRMDYTSFDDYWTPFAGRDGPHAEYVATLDGVRRERFREAVRLAYLDGEDDGPRSFAALAFSVKGTVPG